MPTPPVIDSDHLRSAFDLPPEKAITYLSRKGYEISWSWQDTAAAAHHQAFTVAKVMQMDILQDIRGMLDKAQKEGLPFEEFQKQLQPKLEAKGWWGRQVVKDPDGNDQEVELGSPWRLETIYRTNIGAAHMAGRYLQSMKHAGRRPFWRYVATLDNRTRDSHRGLDGMILFYDDAFWSTGYPPNGYNCRCTVQTLSASQLKREGITFDDLNAMAPPADFKPHEAFRSDPATAWQPDLTKYPRDLRELYKDAVRKIPPPPPRAPVEPDRLEFGDPADRDAITAQYFNAAVTVRRNAVDENDIRRVERDFFGRELTDLEWIRVTGAPDGAEIEVNYYPYASAGDGGEMVYARIRHDTFYDAHCGRESKRSIYRDKKGRLELHNDILMLDQANAPKGLGTRIFSTQVAQARMLGIRHISVYAAGDVNNPKFKGYAVWPRLGYQAVIPARFAQKLAADQSLPAKARNAKTFIDLMGTPEGQEWWRINGSNVNLDFSLNTRSRSMTYLRRMLRRNGVRL